MDEREMDRRFWEQVLGSGKYADKKQAFLANPHWLTTSGCLMCFIEDEDVLDHFKVDVGGGLEADIAVCANCQRKDATELEEAISRAAFTLAS
jgi:hypothetical protein